MPKVFVSDAICQERLIFSPQQAPDSHSSRGWKALSALYQASLAACGFPIELVVRPEIYQTEWARKVRGVEAGDWHLAVKPIEHLRPFHGIPNVFVCDWPFPELSTTVLNGSPFFDQLRLLKMADAVLCCTGFTAGTLRQAGVERVIVLPPHIPPGPVGGAGGRQGERRNFLCAVDSDHLFRQLGPTIEGFAQVADQRGDLHLVVCLQGDGEQDVAALSQRVAQMAASPAWNEAVSVVIGGGGGLELSELLADADFFLCGHAAAGLYLPLVAAMLAGVPLVTTMSAGTASYLPPDAAVPIFTRRETLVGDDEPISRFMSLTYNPASAEAVRDAVLAAMELDEAARTRMAGTARAVAERQFGLPAFKEGLAQLGEFLPLGQR